MAAILSNQDEDGNGEEDLVKGMRVGSRQQPDEGEGRESPELFGD
jgi:hypothetical protein